MSERLLGIRLSIIRLACFVRQVCLFLLVNAAYMAYLLQFYKNFCAKLDHIIWKTKEGVSDTALLGTMTRRSGCAGVKQIS